MLNSTFNSTKLLDSYVSDWSPEHRSLVRKLVAALTVFVAVPLMLVDGGVAILLYKLRPLKANFAILYMSMVALECSNLFIFAVWQAPVVAFGDESIGHSYFGQRLVHFMVFMYNMIVFLMAAVAVNRYVAIVMPYKYNQYFTKDSGIATLLIILVLAVLNTTMYWFEGCGCYISPSQLGLVFEFTACGDVLWWHCTVSCTAAMFILVGFNTMTVLHMHRKKREAVKQLLFHRRQPVPQTETVFSIKYIAPATMVTRHTLEFHDHQKTEIENMRKIEIRFFVQTLLNAIAFEGTVISYHVFSLFTTTALDFFFVANLPLIIVHGTNGVIMLAVNGDLRKSIIEWARARYHNQTLATPMPSSNVRLLDRTETTARSITHQKF